MAKLKRKQEKIITKLTAALEVKGVTWKRHEGMRPSYEIKTMKQKLDFTKIK